jgi:anti-sigma factor RsiW
VASPEALTVRVLPHPCPALSGYVDGRVTGWRRAVLERHLARCTWCALEVARTRAVRGWLAAAPAPEPPPDLQERLLDIAGPRPAAAVPPPRHRRPVATVGVLVAGVLLVGTAGAGAVATSASGPWSGTATRTSLTSVLPRMWSGAADGTASKQTEPAGATTAGPVDNGARP